MRNMAGTIECFWDDTSDKQLKPPKVWSTKIVPAAEKCSCAAKY